MELLWLTLGLWRCWLGGGIGKNWPIKSGITSLQLAAALLLVYLATWPLTWQLTLIHAIGVLAIARLHGHGPMLQEIGRAHV